MVVDRADQQLIPGERHRAKRVGPDRQRRCPVQFGIRPADDVRRQLAESQQRLIDARFLAGRSRNELAGNQFLIFAGVQFFFDVDPVAVGFRLGDRRFRDPNRGLRRGRFFSAAAIPAGSGAGRRPAES
jgi:hypothetical protein